MSSSIYNGSVGFTEPARHGPRSLPSSLPFLLPFLSLPLCLELRSSWPRCLLRVRTRRLLPKLSFLFLTLSNKDSSREAWKNFMKDFVCLKPGIRRHWRRQGFKGSLCCCVPSGPASSVNLEHFIFKDVRNTGDVGWQPEKCCCCCC